VSSRAQKKRKSSRQGTTTPGNASIVNPNADLTERERSRIPSAKPSSRATVAGLRDNVEFEEVAQQVPRQSGTSNLANESEEIRPSVNHQYSTVSESRLPERMRLAAPPTRAPKSPIGSRADIVHEQTTLGHVEPNATLEPTRAANTINRAERKSKSPEGAAKTSPTGVLGTIKPLHKPRAIKTSATPPTRSKKRPARNHRQGPGECSLISTSPRRNEVEEEPFKSHSAKVDDQQPTISGRSPERQDFIRPDVSSRNMGAQTSALTTTPVSVLKKPEGTTREAPQACSSKTQSDVAIWDVLQGDDATLQDFGAQPTEIICDQSQSRSCPVQSR
jgi:hypothetical protein